MNRIGAFHSPATFAFRGKELTVQLFLPDGESAVEALWLSYTVTLQGGKGGASARVRMLPADGFTARDSFSLYRAKIPARDLVGGELFYSFFRGDAESEAYTVPLFDAPTLPALTVTEIAPWNGAACSFVELFNPTAHTVDLFDFELLLEGNGVLQGRNPLAARHGEHLLEKGALAALRFVTPDTGSDFYTDMAQQFPTECGDIAELAPHAFTVTVSGEDTFLLSRCVYQAHTYHIVPRGKSAAEAIFSVTLNDGVVDIRRTRSVFVAFDPREPWQGKIAARAAAPTPGFRGEGEQAFDFADTIPPAILPIEPEGRCRITAGDLKIRFAVVGRTVAEPAVYLRIGKAFRRLPALLQNDGVWECTLPHRDALQLGTRLAYYIKVTGGLYTVTCGDRHAPITLRVSDGAGPLITHSYPAEGEVLERERQPRICVRFADLSGVNCRTSIFCLDGKNLSDRAEWSADAVRYTPERLLSFGKHVLELSLRDMTGNRTYRRIEFSVSDGKTLYPFRGELHSHTAMSDGTGLFGDAYPYAREVGKVDFFAVTDHSHYLTDDEFSACRARAHAESTKGFVALFGEEITWTHHEGYWGHMNLIEPDARISARDVDLPTLYERLARDENAIAMFNHPCDVWGDFDAFGHITPEVRERVCLVEIKNALFDNAYALALSRGWRVAPFSSEDNHGKEWTTETRGTGVLLAPALTRENLLFAIRNRRAYSTTDHTLKLMFAVNGTPLGGVLHDPAKLTVTVHATTERQQGLGRFMLIAEDHLVVAEVNAGVLREFSWEIEVDPDFDYYYLKVVNGDEYTVTAPVFITGRDALSIAEMSLGVTNDPEQPHAVALTLANKGEHTLDDLTVDLYLSPLGGFRLRDAVPFATVHLDDLAEGEERSIVRAFPDVPGNRRVTAVVSAHHGKHRYADTRYLVASPVYIAKVLPCTSPEGDVAEPYPYIELHNPTAKDALLEGCVLQRRRIVGREPVEREQLPLDGVTVPARGRLVIWRRPVGSALTAADFNARYGTSLTEGVDLIVTEQAILSPASFGCRVELWQGKELLSRAAYGNYCGKEALACDSAVLFAPAEDMTPNARKLPPQEGVRPLDEVEAATLPLYGSDALAPASEDERDEEEHKRKTKLSHAPLVPLQAAALLAGAFSAFKDFFRSKE